MLATGSYPPITRRWDAQSIMGQMSSELPCFQPAGAVDVNQWAYVAHESVARGARAEAAAARAPRPRLAEERLSAVPRTPAESERATSVRARRTAPAGAARLRRVRVVLADDDHLFATALKAAVAESDRLDVVGCARNGEEAVSLVTALKPDLVLLDLHMPILDGLGAARQILQAGNAQVVLITGSSNPDDAARAEALGVAAVLEKALGLEELVSQILLLPVFSDGL
jgi:CheY-like chemotaxis protein